MMLTDDPFRLLKKYGVNVAISSCYVVSFWLLISIHLTVSPHISIWLQPHRHWMNIPCQVLSAQLVLSLLLLANLLWPNWLITLVVAKPSKLRKATKNNHHLIACFCLTAFWSWSCTALDTFFMHLLNTLINLLVHRSFILLATLVFKCWLKWWLLMLQH